MIKNISLALLVASASAISIKRMDPAHGPPIAICNGANAGACTEADEVVVHKLRRPYKRAAPGDPDFPAQEEADKARMANQGVKSDAEALVQKNGDTK